jgi:hypothetical protein
VSWLVDERLRVAENRDVLAFLERSQPSAHSDVASELDLGCRGLPGVRLYCPDPSRYAWVGALDREQRIFGLAYGMRELALRVGTGQADAAVASGGELVPELGPGWVGFDAFVVDEPQVQTRARIRDWCRVALTAGQTPARAEP